MRPSAVLAALVGMGYLGAMVTAKVGSTPAVLDQLDLMLQLKYTQHVYKA